MSRASCFSGGDLDEFLGPLIPSETKGYEDCVGADARSRLNGPAHAALHRPRRPAGEASSPRIDAAIARVLAHGGYVMGPEVAAFEKRLAAFGEARLALSCANGTDALALPLMAWDIGAGRRGLLPLVHLRRHLRGDPLDGRDAGVRRHPAGHLLPRPGQP